MIKKLEIKEVPNPNNPALVKNVGMGNESLFDKINELVDAVNELQKDYDNVCIWVGEQNLKAPAENVHDKFAEQRKWIGKLCRFWDFVYDRDYFDTLKGITDEGLFIGHNGSWKYCEPVKPTDSIIYKGGDND